MSTNPDRTTTLGGEARRAQLVGCAIDALCETGYAGASIAEVARRAGVSKGVVTYHFPSKQSLLGEVAASLYRLGGEAISARTAGRELTGVDTVVGYVEANLAFVAAHPRHVRAVMEIAANATSPATAQDDPLVAHLAGLIAAVPAPGVDADALALIVRSAIDAAAARAATDTFDMPAFTRQLVATLRATFTTGNTP